MRMLARWCLAVLCLCSTAGWAQGLESALSPGSLIKGHAKWQDECSSCHVRFDRAAQDGLCMDCHKAVGQDIKAHTGFHGRQKPQACRACHTDHKGREARIVQLNPKDFDHRQTDWPLRAAHQAVECAKCHSAGKPWREAPQTCNACHRKDDKHKGALGAQCADCHTEQSWKDARFDHETTRFSLKGKHMEVKCADCHPNGRYRDVPMTCQGCHRDDDKHKGRYGERCESCHDAKSWKSLSFNHEADTRYALRGKHRNVRCDSCHTGHLYRDKLAVDCQSCHRKDDKHKGGLGTECAACHVETAWKDTGRFDHDRSRFPLLGKHADVDCKSCHKTGPHGAPVYRDTPQTCVACHRKDDQHERTLGEACAACHGERTWKIPRFDHTVAKFALRGAHASPKLACSACHADLKSYRSAPSDCQSCHRKDDKHEGQLGTSCETCHGEQTWRVQRFDHNRARFALLGAHAKVECKACHSTPRYRDAPQDCLACHKKQDTHQARLGERCESCHNARNWKLVSFDHDRQTSYTLSGHHSAVRCEACHTQPAPKGRKTAKLGTDCVACHRTDDTHDGGFGTRCELCHTTANWKQVQPRRSLPTRPSTTASGAPP